MSSFNSPTTTTPNFDNLLLQSLLNRLQIRPKNPLSTPQTTTSFDDFLADHLSSALYFSDDDDGEDDDDELAAPPKTHLAKEEARLEREIVKVILSGKTDSLKPNSGQAVSIGEHHVCVGFHEEDGGSEYRVWEWHGHVMLFDDDHGYSPEYIYGNYFERLVAGRDKKVVGKKEEREKSKEAVAAAAATASEVEEREENSCGLKELIQDDDSVGSRVLHRARNASSPRILTGSSD